MKENTKRNQRKLKKQNKKSSPVLVKSDKPSKRDLSIQKAVAKQTRKLVIKNGIIGAVVSEGENFKQIVRRQRVVVVVEGRAVAPVDAQLERIESPDIIDADITKLIKRCEAVRTGEAAGQERAVHAGAAVQRCKVRA